ncbi:MAG: hypothetical protein JJT82_07305 [Legionellaceae bacterium]|nr:hypothetical protein [Legionellaceae bacterium]
MILITSRTPKGLMIQNDIHMPLIRLSPGQESKLSNPAHLLYVGRILKTAIVRPLEHNQVLININGNNINATTSHSLKSGDLLQVKVIAHHEGEIILQALKTPKHSSALARALSHYLPHQLTAGPFYHILRQLLAKEQLPTPLRTVSQSLLQSLPTPGTLPQHFATMLLNSGLFLESRLLRQDKSLRDNQDFKALLLKLLSQLPRSPHPIKPAALDACQQNVPLPGSLPQALPSSSLNGLADLAQEPLLQLLAQQAEGVLARLICYQLQQSTQNQAPPWQLSIDLPLQLGDSIDIIPLKISQSPPRSKGKACQWHVLFALELPRIGALQGRLILQGTRLDAYFNTENEAGLSFLTPYAADWQKLVAHMGLNMGQWQVAVGLHEEPPQALNFQLIDIHL